MDIERLLVNAIRKLMPDLDHYMRMQRKAKVTRVRKDGSQRLVDLEILRNDGSKDPDSPALKKVELDTLGICPQKGAIVTVSYDRGDPGAPVVTGIRDYGRANVQAVLIDIGHGVFLEINDEGHYVASGASWTFDGEMAEE